MKTIRSIAVIGALFLLCGPLKADKAGRKPVLRPTAVKPLELSAWLAFWDGPTHRSFESFKAHVGRLARVYPEAYLTQPDGTPGRVLSTRPEDLAQTVALAHAHGVKVLGQVQNWDYRTNGFDAVRVEKFLRDKGSREKHISALLSLAQGDHLDGLSLDYEGLGAVDRDAYSAFVSDLCGRAHALGMQVGVALYAKESEPGGWSGAQSQDDAALGKAADVVQVMTYDFHWATGPPGSLAPPAWFRSSGAFAASRINPDKVELGVNAYGYAWRPKGETLGWQSFLALIARSGRPVRDPDTLELKLSLQDGEAWMPDARTSGYKFKIARELGVRGVHLFELGEEDPATWNEWDRSSAAGSGPSNPSWP